MFYNITVAEGGYYHGYHSVFDGDEKINLNFYPVNDTLLDKKFHAHPDVLKLKYFSKNMYVFERDEQKLYFCDVRFGRIGGYSGGPSKWVFRWEIQPQTDGTLKIVKGKWSMSRFKAVGELFGRIF